MQTIKPKQRRRAPTALKTIVASLAIAGLMASYLLPGYADTFAVAAQPQQLGESHWVWFLVFFEGGGCRLG